MTEDLFVKHTAHRHFVLNKIHVVLEGFVRDEDNPNAQDQPCSLVMEDEWLDFSDLTTDGIIRIPDHLSRFGQIDHDVSQVHFVHSEGTPEPPVLSGKERKQRRSMKKLVKEGGAAKKKSHK
jgi:hypothetical protein